MSKPKDNLLRRFICCDCAYSCGHKPKYPADSGVESWLCDRCGHFNIGSFMLCKMGDWLTLIPKEYCK